MIKALVTGGAGFIGSHVARHLLDVGYDVHIADRFSYAGKVRHIKHFLRDAKLWVGDLQSPDFCERLADFGFEFIVHTAGNTHVDRAISDPIQFTMDNVLGTNQLLHAFERKHLEKRPDCLKKIIVYSTDEVFGSTPLGERYTEYAAINPSNAYSASKTGVEGLARAYYVTFKTPTVIVRPCNTYGRGQHPEKAIPRFTTQALRGEAMTVHNDGTGSRDWLHTTDHASAIQTLIEEGQLGHSYNLAAGDEHTDEEVARRIFNILGLPAKITFVPGRPGHDRRYWMSNQKIGKLGWHPKVSFEEGLKDAVMWTKKNMDWWDHDYIPVEDLSVMEAM